MIWRWGWSCKQQVLIIWLAVMTFVGLAMPAQAQLQRSFINQGFEAPNLEATNCYRQLADSQVPGWSTTHPSQATGGTCPITANPTSGPLIELWGNNFTGVPAREGSQFAELNAEAASRLYQTVCLVAGEQFAWRFSHRRRAAIGSETLDFNIAPTGSGATTQISRSIANATGWFDRSGTFTVTAANAGVQTLGFSAVGGSTTGNFLDAIQITLTPYVEFQPSSGSGVESIASANVPTLRLSGTLTAPLVVQVSVTGGTATLGTDYTTPSGSSAFNVTIPAGDYDGTQLVSLGINIVNDTVIEANETILLSLTANPAVYTIASTQSCGTSPVNNPTYTILDNDARIRVQKALARTRLAASDQFVMSIAGPNGPVSATTGGLGSTITGGIADLQNITAGSTYTLSEAMAPGAASPLANYGHNLACSNARVGSTTVLPSGAVSSATVTPAIGDDITCTFTNTALPQVTAAKQASASPLIVGAAGQTYTIVVTVASGPTTAPITIADTFAGGITLAGAPGVSAGATLSGCNSTGNTLGAACQLNSNLANGSYTVTIPINVANTAANGNNTANLAGGGDPNCTSATGQACDPSVTVPIGRQADVRVAKTNTPASGQNDQAGDTVTSGTATTYQLVVTNGGPSPVTGVVVRDTPGAEITCPPGNAVTITGSGVPGGSFTITNLTGAGITLGTLTSGQSTTMTFSCTVN